MNQATVWFCAIIALGIFTGAAAMADCPVTVTGFWFSALGAPNGFAQYQVAVQTGGSGPIGVRLNVSGTSVSKSSTVYVPSIDFELPERDMVTSGVVPTLSANLIFAWPTTDVSAISVREVIFPSGLTTDCSGSSSTKRRPPVLIQTAWHFDDTKVTVQPEMIGAVVTSPAFIHRVQPSYPELAAEDKEQGDVLVQVTIGTSGRVIAASVLRSSGSGLLDNAAIGAARASIFTVPKADGQPVAATYALQYIFFFR